ncbi:hypothetical protein LTR85_002360 [Meristemomyces frigidus]|nr:hypothetical protein LTR85_002360 [Meristemomyces frigidus]
MRELVHSALQTASELPKVRSVTILSDCLAYSPKLKGAVTVREFMEAYGLGELTCVEVGRYRLSTDYGDVTVANSKILKMWPNVASTPLEYDAKAEARRVIDEWLQPRIFKVVCRTDMAWAAHTSLRLWVGLFEEALAAKYSVWDEDGDVDDIELEYRHDVIAWLGALKIHEAIGWTPPGVDGRHVAMHTLGPQHDAVTLEWATELLAMNIETYFTSDPSRLFGPDVDAKACWAELEDGESVGAVIHARHVEWRRRHYVQSPVDDNVEYSIIGLKNGLAVEKSLCFALGVEASDLDVTDDVSNEEVKKLFRLSVALGLSDLYDEGGTDNPERRQALDEWSHTLLCKYLRSITHAADGVFEDWDHVELRGLGDILIRMLEQRVFEVYTMPGAFPVGDEPFDVDEGNHELDAAVDGDEELYRPFVMKASKAWRLLCHCTPAAHEAEEEADMAGWGNRGCVVC